MVGEGLPGHVSRAGDGGDRGGAGGRDDHAAGAAVRSADPPSRGPDRGRGPGQLRSAGRVAPQRRARRPGAVDQPNGRKAGAVRERRSPQRATEDAGAARCWAGPSASQCRRRREDRDRAAPAGLPGRVRRRVARGGLAPASPDGVLFAAVLVALQAGAGGLRGRRPCRPGGRRARATAADLHPHGSRRGVCPAGRIALRSRGPGEPAATAHQPHRQRGGGGQARRRGAAAGRDFGRPVRRRPRNRVDSGHGRGSGPERGGPPRRGLHHLQARRRRARPVRGAADRRVAPRRPALGAARRMDVLPFRVSPGFRQRPWHTC